MDKNFEELGRKCLEIFEGYPLTILTYLGEEKVKDLEESLAIRTRERDDIYEKLTAEIRELKRERDEERNYEG